MSEASSKSLLGSAAKAAQDYGIDLSLIDASLEKTPTERLQIHQMALNTVYELRRAFIATHGHQPDPQQTSRKRD